MQRPSESLKVSFDCDQMLKRIRSRSATVELDDKVTGLTEGISQRLLHTCTQMGKCLNQKNGHNQSPFGHSTNWKFCLATAVSSNTPDTFLTPNTTVIFA